MVVCLTAIAVGVRVGGLAPSSLWHDDIWVAYAARSRYSDIPMMAVTSPGFVFLEKAVFDLVGFSAFTAQLLPFLASSVTPAVVFVVLKRAVRVELAVTAGIVVALTTLNVQYSYHVKQFTVEALGAALIFLVTARWMTEPTRRRQWALVATICVTAAVSFLVVVVATGPIAVVAVRLLRRRPLPQISDLVPLGVLGLFVVGWYAFVIMPNTTDNLQAYWADFYVRVDGGPIDFVVSLRDRVWFFLQSLTPWPPLIVATTCIIAFSATFVLRRDWAVVTTLPLLVALLLAVLQKAPFGAGRVDNYLLIPLVFGFFIGLDALCDVAATEKSRIRVPGTTATLSGLAGAALIGLTIGGFESPTAYPAEDIRPLIEILEDDRRDGDAVVLYYASTFAYGLYADVESRPIDVGTPYSIEFDDPDLVVQNPHRNEPEKYLQYATEAAGRSDRIWLLGSHLCACDWGPIERQFAQELGWRRERIDAREGASLQLWSRPSG